MLLKIIPLVFVCARLCDAIVYDRLSGQVATDEQLRKYEQLGATSTCTKDIEPCDATERRRVDGSCNNLANPMNGTYFKSLRRELEAHYYNGSYSRKAADGTDLKLPRYIRNLLLWVGDSSNTQFTQAIPGYAIYGFGDIGSVHDIKYFLQNKTDCCTEEGMKSSECSPNFIPEDDQMYRLTGISCLNLTTPLTYSHFGCTDDPEPSPIEEATGVFDLSPIYNAADGGDSAVRSYEGGKLIVDIDEDGIIWPPNGDGFCTANQPGETRCFGNYPNTLLSVMLLAIWYMRQHNYFASQLAAVNPSWDDDKLFYTARDINIAFHTQVYYYEWLKALIGEEKLIEKGILSSCSGHRDIYDDSEPLQVSLEFTYILRWFHTMQGGIAAVYDTDGTYLKDYPYVNFTMRPGYLGVDQNIRYFTQHMHRQPCGEVGPFVHPDLAENGLPYIQRSVDIMTSDLHKSRLLGFAPYIDYVHFCTGHNVTSFDDLELHIDQERVSQLKKVYDDVIDIDLMAGLWVEKWIEGGNIPATMACLMMEYLKKAIQSDRHWYESSKRPYAFNEDQLAEVRKGSTLARLMCNVADDVTEIQPQAFHTIDSDDNPLKPCSEIPSIDFTKWADSSSTSDTSTSTDDTTSSSDASSSSSASSDTTTDDTTSSSDASSSSSASSDTTTDDTTSSSDASSSSSASSDTTTDDTTSSSDAPSSSSASSDTSDDSK